MPAAAVIPALIAYTKVAAVKKLVVGFWRSFGAARSPECAANSFLLLEDLLSSSLSGGRDSGPLL